MTIFFISVLALAIVFAFLIEIGALFQALLASLRYVEVVIFDIPVSVIISADIKINCFHLNLIKLLNDVILKVLGGH